MKKIIKFSIPYIDDREIRSVASVMRSGWWTTGEVAARFEEEFCGYIGRRYALAVNSATSALHLALKVAGIGPGDEVIVPTMTFAATAEVVIHCGAKPVLCDCDTDTLNIDINDLKKKITRRTRVVIPVHMAGLPCRMEKIKSAARPRGIYIIEDAAHALGAEYKNRKAGTFGDLAAFSFYATKPISTGEGGMLVSNNRKFMELARCMSLHGLTRNAWDRYSVHGNPYYRIVYPGFKYNMPDILAAIGLYQLRKANRLLRIRRRYADMYNDALRGNPCVTLPKSGEGMKHAWHLYIIKLNTEEVNLSRDEFMARLIKEGVHTSVHFMPLHMHPFYKKTFGFKNEDFPNASAVFKRIVSLPIYPQMSALDIKFVISRINKVTGMANK